MAQLPDGFMCRRPPLSVETNIDLLGDEQTAASTLNLSCFRTAPSARLSNLPFENDGALQARRSLTAALVIEPVAKPTKCRSDVTFFIGCSMWFVDSPEPGIIGTASLRGLSGLRSGRRRWGACGPSHGMCHIYPGSGGGASDPRPVQAHDDAPGKSNHAQLRSSTSTTCAVHFLGSAHAGHRHVARRGFWRKKAASGPSARRSTKIYRAAVGLCSGA